MTNSGTDPKLWTDGAEGGSRGPRRAGPRLVALLVVAFIGIGLVCVLWQLIGGPAAAPTSSGNAVATSSGDAAMNDAVAEARRTVDQFIAALKDPAPNQKGFAIKMVTDADGGGHVHYWVNKVRYDGETFAGEVADPQRHTTRIKQGDDVSAKPSEISDWMYRETTGEAAGDEVVVGAFTLRVLRDRARIEGGEEAAYWEQFKFKGD